MEGPQGAEAITPVPLRGQLCHKSPIGTQWVYTHLTQYTTANLNQLGSK